MVQGEGHTILVDTGYKYLEYGQELADLFGVTNWRSPQELLGFLGIEPGDVDTLLLTHAHWDHMGYMEAFPNATIHLQRHELEGWLRALALPERFGFLQGGVDPAAFHHLLERSLVGQVRLLDGPVTNVLPGIDLVPAFETHTHGSQYVVITTTNSADPGTWVAVGDAVFAIENLTGLDDSGVYVPVGTGDRLAGGDARDLRGDHAAHRLQTAAHRARPRPRRLRALPLRGVLPGAADRGGHAGRR